MSQGKETVLLGINNVLKGCIAVDQDQKIYFYNVRKKGMKVRGGVYVPIDKTITFLCLGKEDKSNMTFEDGCINVKLDVETSFKFSRMRKSEIDVPNEKPVKAKKAKPTVKTRAKRCEVDDTRKLRRRR